MALITLPRCIPEMILFSWHEIDWVVHDGKSHVASQRDSKYPVILPKSKSWCCAFKPSHPSYYFRWALQKPLRCNHNHMLTAAPSRSSSYRFSSVTWIPSLPLMKIHIKRERIDASCKLKLQALATVGLMQVMMIFDIQKIHWFALWSWEMLQPCI